MLENLTTDGLLAYARANSAREFNTLTRAKAFKIQVVGDTLAFSPNAEQKKDPRTNRRHMLDKYVTMFNEHRNFLTGPYVAANLHDSSYFLTIVAEMIDRGELAAYDDESLALLKACDSLLEKELTLFLSRSTRHSQDRARNIELIAYYFGFRQDPSPSQVDAAKVFGIKTRERARQVLDNYFYNVVATGDLPSLITIGKRLETRMAIAAGAFLDELRTAGLVSTFASARGILDLLQEGLKLCLGFQLYTPELEAATREKWGRTEEVFFVRNDLLGALQQAMGKVVGRPGKEGIADLNVALLAMEGLSAEQKQIVRELVIAAPSVWTFESGGAYSYLFEDRQNPLINQLEKIHGVIEACPIDELVQALCRGAALPEKAGLVAAWLGQTELVEICGGIATISAVCKKTALTPAEKDAYDFLVVPENKDTLSGPLSEWMARKGHPKPTTDSIVFRSAFIHIDEAGGRGKRTYRLIGGGAGAPPPSSDAEKRYFEFKEKLRHIGREGTDRLIISKQRKEQQALQDWVFRDGMEYRCAICGRIFDRNALRAAHKKPRRSCTQMERLDPHIVMPLCLLGCDFLYEEGHIYVDGGIVAARPNNRLPEGLKISISALAGRKLPAEWAAGLSSYFRSVRPAD